MINHSENDNQTIAPEENCLPVGVRVWFRVNVSFRVRGQFSSGAIVLETVKMMMKMKNRSHRDDINSLSLDR